MRGMMDCSERRGALGRARGAHPAGYGWERGGSGGLHPTAGGDGPGAYILRLPGVVGG